MNAAAMRAGTTNCVDARVVRSQSTRPFMLELSTSGVSRLAPKTPAGRCRHDLLACGRIRCLLIVAIEQPCHLPLERFCLDLEVAGDVVGFLDERCGSFLVVFGAHGVLP